MLTRAAKESKEKMATGMHEPACLLDFWSLQVRAPAPSLLCYTAYVVFLSFSSVVCGSMFDPELLTLADAVLPQACDWMMSVGLLAYACVLVSGWPSL